MPNSISEVFGIHVQNGFFEDGANLDVFRADINNRNTTRASVVFGHNGSGKTTIAEAFESIASDDGTIKNYLYDTSGIQLSLNERDCSRIRVFTEKYVRDKVLIRSDGIESIVMLGTQVEACKRIDELDNELVRLGELEADWQIIKHNVEEGPGSPEKLEALAKKNARDGGWATRRSSVEGGRQNLTQQRWDAILEAKPTNARRVLQEEFDHNLDEFRRATDIGAPIEGAIHEIPLSDYDESSLTALLGRIIDEPTLTEREERILHLVQHNNQHLVELAYETFSISETEVCPMCQQRVTSEHKASLVESILKILNKKVDEYRAVLKDAKLEQVSEDADSFGDIPNHLLSGYLEAVHVANMVIATYNGLIDQRLNALYVPIEEHQLGLTEAIAHLNAEAKAVNSVIDSINEAVRQRENLRQRLLQINDQIARLDASGQIALLGEASARLKEADDQLRDIQSKRRLLSEKRSVEESRLSITDIAAKRINTFLASVFFDSSRFTLVPSGSVYRLRSNSKPVQPQQISTGERNLLGLCYFFSEGARGRFEGTEDDEAQLVVLDDPVSSFDMENRIGICSLLRERLERILSANGESKVVILTHDASVAAEMEHILSDIKDAKKGTQLEFSYHCNELRDNKMVDLQLVNGEYAMLLKRAYDFAVSEQENIEESYVIGNILRRILEGYGFFNYGLGIEQISRDVELSKRFGRAGDVLKSMMYRLALNDESHMRERLTSLSPVIDFERYSYEEKRVAAQCVLVILHCMDKQHITKRLKNCSIPSTELTRNLKLWEERFTPSE